jgi:hypothetical protein
MGTRQFSLTWAALSGSAELTAGGLIGRTAKVANMPITNALVTAISAALLVIDLRAISFVYRLPPTTGV